MAVRKKIDLDSLLDDSGTSLPKGHDVRSLGPSDSSDTGADMTGIGGADSTGDRFGTGDRASVDDEYEIDAAADIGADSIVDAAHAGLGGGLDQAEEAQQGITDEELLADSRRRAGLARD